MTCDKSSSHKTTAAGFAVFLFISVVTPCHPFPLLRTTDVGLEKYFKSIFKRR